MSGRSLRMGELQSVEPQRGREHVNDIMAVRHRAGPEQLPLSGETSTRTGSTACWSTSSTLCRGRRRHAQRERSPR